MTGSGHRGSLWTTAGGRPRGSPGLTRRCHWAECTGCPPWALLRTITVITGIIYPTPTACTSESDAHGLNEEGNTIAPMHQIWKVKLRDG